ncbi:hypothetical protein X801_01335 [Opisthorchis viverrini]|uniref:Nucleolar protein 16 n=1 Tax=Opisthorchis viverrini TaxID=6198 RepID=A0A1S8X7T1_OPIVI|nr:hypothetical protein X801_01335 [Opisthorchis viverrini]
MSKKKSFRYSRNAKKLRRKEKARLKIKNPIIDSAWKHGLSVKSNFNRLGIAYDPNEVLKISSRQAMSRDPKNVYQLTPKQLQRLIGKFKKTPGYQQYLSQKETGTFSVADVYDISVA